MITGTVTADLEPVITLVVRTPSGVEFEFDALVDTGFTGFLTLPPDVIAHLGLSWERRDMVSLADGRQVEYDIFTGLVVWDGHPRQVPIDSSDIEPLLGTRLMAGFRLTSDFRPGGPVVLEPLP